MFFKHHLSFKFGHQLHWANHISSYLNSDVLCRAGEGVLTSVAFGELCPHSLQLKCKQQYCISQGTPNVLELIMTAFSPVLMSRAVECDLQYLRCVLVFVGFFVWLFVEYCFKMASDTLCVLAPFPSRAHAYLHRNMPDECHVAKGCANGCVGVMFSLTLIVLSHLLKNFALF